MEYSDDINDGVFDYTYYGKAMYRPKVKWAERPRTDLIIFDKVVDTAELEKGLRIGNTVPLTTTRAIQSLIVKYWDCFCA